jgi:hypothetical protein
MCWQLSSAFGPQFMPKSVDTGGFIDFGMSNSSSRQRDADKFQKGFRSSHWISRPKTVVSATLEDRKFAGTIEVRINGVTRLFNKP